MSEKVVELFDGKASSDRKGKDGGGGGGAERQEIKNCPVRPIGFNDGVYYYVTPSGSLRQLTAQKHNHNNIFSLFEDQGDWLREAFMKSATRSNVSTWNAVEAGEYLMSEAAKVGLVDLERSLRGFGVWRLRDGRLIVHCGDEIEVDDEWQAAGQKIENRIFIALPPIDRPGASEANATQMMRLFDFIRSSWAWRNPLGDARLLLGWIGCGILAGALNWRPHIWNTADRGAGKSKLDDLVQSLLGSGADKVSDPTGAGVRGLLGVSARGILADEVEPGDNRRAEGMIELARMASTDSQGDVIRGSSDGRSQRFPIRACFLFSSILVPKFRPQDYGRITILEMKPLPSKTHEEIRDFELAFKDLASMGGVFRRRVINAFSRFEENLQIYSMLMASDGNGRRAADQLATLLAMCDAILLDEIVDLEEARRVLSNINVAELTGGEEIGDDKECLQHLLSTKKMVRFSEGTKDYTLGELIEACPPKATNWRNKFLRQNGLSVVSEEGANGPVDFLVISNTHTELKRIFKDTRWQSGGHARVLKRLPYAQEGMTKAVSFAGFKSAATWLLMEDLPIERSAEQEGGEEWNDDGL